MKDRLVFNCSIAARKAGAIGDYTMHATCQVYAKDEEEARKKAFDDICINQNLETCPPMTMSIVCTGVDDSGLR